MFIIIFSAYCDMFQCFNVQKALDCSHTACAAAPIFTHLLWLVTPSGGNFGIVAFADDLHATNLYNTLQERETKKV